MEFDLIKKEVGKRIQTLRKANGETQKELAEAIQTSKDSIAKIEQGKVSLTLDNQFKIVEHYNVSHDYICCRSDIENNNLQILNEFISFKLAKYEFGDKYQIPTLKINSIFFNYLFQSFRATESKDIPEDVRETWLKIEKDKFFNGIKNSDNKNFKEFVLVNKKFLSSEERMREVEKLAENLNDE